MTTPTLAYRIARHTIHTTAGYTAATRAMDIARRAAWVAVLAAATAYLAMLAVREVVGVVFDVCGW